MLTTSPYLHTRRPSPTAAEFTLSTLPLPLNLPRRVILLALNGIRVLFGLTILLLLYSKWLLSSYSRPFPSSDHFSPPPLFFSDGFIQKTIFIFLTTTPAQLSIRLADATPLWILLPATAAGLYFILLRIYTEESLLVLRGLGIQTSSSANTVLGSPVTRFIPTEKILDVLVNEAFLGFEVRYYLVVVVEDDAEVVVVFPKLLPRRKVVEEVWRGVRGCLREGKGYEREE
ncbi:GPI-GlcNAc transferase complex, PIG-H component-domain-containing protein [Pseudomassariella vexata]|uniref:GPI-GlcNAc transferase complex, PIG-H component-domain-containing protein n=1 Tax=Pseudomassariella vexata TaxID=1141098 RepID=A0A1Y2D742_9PEZI|nr:GPI-GlcNAc transferase complex, PIG-H component-domain-containing protein [Pseudomassariella vexata]ORY55092.1 GPI-GlcNAc transferase complex, PIG-H component-domain-containing protein [Pseudomassariella vexata]